MRRALRAGAGRNRGCAKCAKRCCLRSHVRVDHYSLGAEKPARIWITPWRKLSRELFLGEVRLKGPVFCAVSIVIVFWLDVGAIAQSAETLKAAKKNSSASEIARFFVEEAPKDSAYETGPLHIIYGDGTEIVKTLPPLRANTEKEVFYNAVGFSGVQLADDRRTLGWTTDIENCCTSYPVPMGVVVLRDKKVLHKIYPGLGVWAWMFVQGGERVAIVTGQTHGPEVGDYRLYDVSSGKLISEVWGDEKLQSLKPSAPEWAKRLQDRYHGE